MVATLTGTVGSRWRRLIPKFHNDRFRRAYFEKSLKAFIANQIRALRGDLTQPEFGKRIGQTQSVVSRLEDETYGRQNTQTLIDIAQRLNLALVIKFVDYKTFLETTEDMSPRGLVPPTFNISDLETENSRSPFGAGSIGEKSLSPSTPPSNSGTTKNPEIVFVE